MRHTDYNTLIARGRKAGLSTRDIYAALTGNPPDANEQQMGRADSNGYVTGYNQNGHVVYRPTENETENR